MLYFVATLGAGTNGFPKKKYNVMHVSSYCGKRGDNQCLATHQI